MAITKPSSTRCLYWAVSRRHPRWLTIVAFALSAGACSGGVPGSGLDADASNVKADGASGTIGVEGGFAQAIFPILQAEGCGAVACHTMANVIVRHWALTTPADTYARWVNFPGFNHCDPNGQPIVEPMPDQIRVIPGDPDHSLVMKKLTDPWGMCGPFFGHMPPPPQARLPAGQIDLIRAWIAAGAPL